MIIEDLFQHISKRVVMESNDVRKFNIHVYYKYDVAAPAHVILYRPGFVMVSLGRSVRVDDPFDLGIRRCQTCKMLFDTNPANMGMTISHPVETCDYCLGIGDDE